MSLSNEAVERAARAGYEMRFRRPWSGLSKMGKEHECEIARAALEASGLAAEVERLTGVLREAETFIKRYLERAASGLEMAGTGESDRGGGQDRGGSLDA